MKAKKKRSKALRYGNRAAVLEKKGRFVVAGLVFERGVQVMVDKESLAGASVGDMVLVQADPGRARVVGRLGSPDSARDMVAALLADRGFPKAFPKHVSEGVSSGRAGEDGARRDLRDLPTFTVDPVTAKDYDDAISVVRESGSTRLYVHIADVSAYVELGSTVEEEALKRGCSVYVPGHVVPMLPEKLSNDECSLMPGEPRRAVTVEMLMDGGGEVEKVDFYRSTISSDRRFSYDEVDDLFQGRGESPGDLGRGIELARGIASELQDRRSRRGALTLTTDEPEYQFNRQGELVGARRSEQTEAHGLIEELMILTNEQVAEHLQSRGSDLLYRVHEQPPPQAVEFLVEKLSSLDVPTPPKRERLTPKQAGDLMAEISHALEKYSSGREHGRVAYTGQLLRALQQAFYSPSNIGHAGLSSPTYCHFTSPIRRYPDLVVHRALLKAISANGAEQTKSDIERAGWHSSSTERAAVEVERDADDICLSYLLKKELDREGWERTFEGEVVGLIPAGSFVRCDLFEGFLPARRLGGERYRLNELGTALVGTRSGSMVKLGDPVDVRVERVEWERGRVDLYPAPGGDGER